MKYSSSCWYVGRISRLSLAGLEPCREGGRECEVERPWLREWLKEGGEREEGRWCWEELEREEGRLRWEKLERR